MTITNKNNNKMELFLLIDEICYRTYVCWRNSDTQDVYKRQLLSDPNNETPLKAISTELGFNSISTFYNLFQSSVGMTPSQYRNKVMELQKEQ